MTLSTNSVAAVVLLSAGYRFDSNSQGPIRFDRNVTNRLPRKSELVFAEVP